MHTVLDFNRDNRVTEADFENLAIKYLCQQNNRTSYMDNKYKIFYM